ncbi:D-inositol 3-phosphate glycosyltransferase-like [Montipora capricornis]|uniref:D-inositol 3-phosphate glycosyltransferase-like n=1 Tax=Montipora capricornis TaxID=246305 RepID=UPI0035F15F63
MQCGLSANHLRVRGYDKSRESLKQLFCEVDLVIMPSRTDGFGLTGLEALSAGLPVLVSKNSGFGEALCKVPLCSPFVIDSDNPDVWAAAIKSIIWDKDRHFRLDEAKQCAHYMTRNTDGPNKVMPFDARLSNLLMLVSSNFKLTLWLSPQLVHRKVQGQKYIHGNLKRLSRKLGNQALQ